MSVATSDFGLRTLILIRSNFLDCHSNARFFWCTLQTFVDNTEEVLVLLTLVILEDLDRVKFSITGNKILSSLYSNGIAPEVPEDPYHIIKNATSTRDKHLERN
ncbi:hypothetical protein INT47_002655 [Mucor saturninus]|uniref:Uncharacterized protein n=1 Tax=Mucor saturninus TaxID=64648 RepID=A0A8H7R5Y0_9FUNG|nr:hypothetical protein INT47_002655 [Mucor saturninus]